MNDELGNQLTSQWRIPAWVQTRLWASTAHESVAVSGDHGTFRLTVPASVVTVRLGAPDGVALAQLRWRTDALNWTGEVRVGGSIETIHYVGAEEEDTTLAIVCLCGQPLLPGIRPYPLLNAGQFVTPPRPDFFEGIDREQDDSVTTWLVSYTSPLFVLCQDALSNKTNVYAWGRLIERADAAKLMTPLQLHELTFFST